MATETSRRRFWVFIFPTIALIAFDIVAIGVQIIATLPETLRAVNQIEANGQGAEGPGVQ